MDPARQTGWRSGWVLAAIAALLLLAVTAAPAAASGQAVVDDFRANGVITGNFTVTDLQDSKQLFAAQFPPGQLPAIFNQIDDKIAAIFGQKLPADPRADPPEIPPSGAPVWQALLAGAAGLLVLAGAGSGLYRRNRRRMRPG